MPSRSPNSLVVFAVTSTPAARRLRQSRRAKPRRTSDDALRAPLRAAPGGRITPQPVGLAPRRRPDNGHLNTQERSAGIAHPPLTRPVGVPEYPDLCPSWRESSRPGSRPDRRVWREPGGGGGTPPRAAPPPRRGGGRGRACGGPPPPGWGL